MDSYDISEVSRLFGLSPSGLRFYEERGLVTPLRSEGGRRRYSQENLLGLMYLTKMHAMDITLEETRRYFLQETDHSPEETGAFMRARVPAVREKAAYYALLADTLEETARVLCDLQAHIDHWEEERVPALYCLSLSPLFGRGEAEQRALSRWIALQPLNRMLTVLEIDEGAPARFFLGFGVERAYADRLALPLREKAECLPEATALCGVLEAEGTDFGLPRQRLMDVYRSVALPRGWTRARVAFRFFYAAREGETLRKLYQVWVSPLAP